MIKVKLNLIFFLISIIILVKSHISQPTAIIEFIRHGARGPLANFFDSNWQNNTYGQLTPTGMHQHFILGKQLAKKYPGILGAYDPTKIYVRSTDVNRTIMSAISQLMGIYYDEGGNLTQQQIKNGVPPYEDAEEIAASIQTTAALPNNVLIPPVHVVQISEDYFLRSYDPTLCPNGEATADSAAIYSNLTQVFQQTISNYSMQLNEIYGLGTSFENYEGLGDALMADLYENLTVPNFTAAPYSSLWNASIMMNYGWTLLTNFGTPQYRALFSLPLYQNLLYYMEEIVNGTSSLKFLFLSAHDTTLLALLSGLNIITPDCYIGNFINNITNDSLCSYPVFASQVIIEMYNQPNGSSNWYINMYYNEIPLYPINSTIGYQMTWTSFVELLNNASLGYTMQDYYNFCAIPTAQSTSALLIIVYCVIGITGILFIALLITIGKKLSQQSQAESSKHLIIKDPLNA